MKKMVALLLFLILLLSENASFSMSFGISDAQWNRGIQQRNTISAGCIRAIEACRRATPRRWSGTGRPRNRGDMWGQYHLGMMYKDGKGVGKDKDTARFWLQKAADQGHAVAKKELAKKWWWPF